MNCPRCKGADPYRLTRRAIFCCRYCHYHFSETSQTIFQAHKLPVETLKRIGELYREGMNARQISFALGIDYRTAWTRTRQVRLTGRTP